VALCIVLVLIGMVTMMCMPVSEMYMLQSTPTHYRSTFLGIYYFVANEIMSGFLPVIGFLIDRFDFYTTFSISSVSVLVLVVVCSIWLLRKK
jgi:MFS family permease